MHRLVDELRSVETCEEIDRIEAEMDRIGYEYEASLRTNGRTADQNHEFAPKRSELEG